MLNDILQMLQTAVYGLFSLGILVFVHELGHFVAGKLTGIRVVTFSIGFGRGILSMDHKGTHYKIGWVPLGGFCRFAGEGEDLRDDRTGAPDEFYERPAWARLITISAGVVANFLLAFLIFSGISLTGYSYRSFDNRITVNDKFTSPEKSMQLPALSAGLKTGDRILSVNGKPTPNFQKLQGIITMRPEEKLTLKVARGDKTNTYYLTSGLAPTGAGYINIRPYYPAIVSNVTSPAARAAGLRPDDEVVRFNDEKVDSIYKLQALLTANETNQARVGVLRDGERLTFSLRPTRHQEKNGQGQGRVRYRIGFIAKSPPVYTYKERQHNLLAAMGKGGRMVGETIGSVFKSIGLIFNPKVDTGKAVGGPIRITGMLGEVMKEGSLAFWLRFMALISLALGLFNILPIPAADGGHVVLTLIEMIRGKRLPFAVLQRIQMVGVMILITLMMFVVVFDLMNVVRA